jgi:DeoR/GlpR family transcriptional regulator of sugar metabolism
MPRVAIDIVEARRKRLAEVLESSGYLPVGELCRRLGVSEATCRRDLTMLVDRDQVRRTFGGALGVVQSPSLGQYDAGFASFRARLRVASGSKSILAQRAVALIKAGQVIFLDAGTTTFRVMEELVRRPPDRLTVVTHSLMVALRLGAVEGMTVHLLGGQVLYRQGLTLGARTEVAARVFDFDLALLGAEAFNHRGIFNSHDDVVRLQKTVVGRSRRVRFLMDKTKGGQTAAVEVFGWERWPGGDVRLLSDADAGLLEKNGVDKRFVARG